MVHGFSWILYRWPNTAFLMFSSDAFFSVLCFSAARNRQFFGEIPRTKLPHSFLFDYFENGCVCSSFPAGHAGGGDGSALLTTPVSVHQWPCSSRPTHCYRAHHSGGSESKPFTFAPFRVSFLPASQSTISRIRLMKGKEMNLIFIPLYTN